MAADPLTLPTPNDYHDLHRVHSTCRTCGRITELDLSDLIRRGFGNTPLARLPLRCSACGSRDVGVIVSGEGWRLDGG